MEKSPHTLPIVFYMRHDDLLNLGSCAVYLLDNMMLPNFMHGLSDTIPQPLDLNSVRLLVCITHSTMEIFTCLVSPTRQ